MAYCALAMRMAEAMNQAVFAFRRYEDASLRYTGIESHEGLSHYGLYDTVVAREESGSVVHLEFSSCRRFAAGVWWLRVRASLKGIPASGAEGHIDFGLMRP